MKETHLYSRLVSKQQSSSASRDFIRTKFICWPGTSLQNQNRKKKKKNNIQHTGLLFKSHIKAPAKTECANKQNSFLDITGSPTSL